MKILKWISNNFLFILTIFLLAFIPLYPKLPLLDVVNTWVYVRAEDFVIVLVVIIWFAMIIFKKVSLKTPLTIPILVFWIIGGLATLHGTLLIFPTIANAYSNVALLSFLRRIEYMSLFFVAFASIKNKKFMLYVIYALAFILIVIVLYGFGQKFFGFPAYLTMNEEFAKGIPIQLSQLSRVPSTFAGHYDLAAYLVLVIPILASVFFGFKNWIIKIFLGMSVISGFALIFMTVSRVSFFVLLLSMLMLLILQKKKLMIVSLLVLTFVLFISFPSLLQRFKSTVSEVNVLVDAKTGQAIGQVGETRAEYFKDKIVKKVSISNKDALNATSSAIVPFSLIPPIVALVVDGNSSTGENLPQGTSYINLPLSPIVRKVDEYYFQKSTDKSKTEFEEISVIYGDYLIKKAKAYDLSFTTRFQGEWPKTFEAFKRNIFLGSGYGSVSLAVDNNYLRMLGESGLFGFIAFISIFVFAVIYIKKILPAVDSSVIKSFVRGFVAGSFGLALNALLIDVFEASKVAFTYWLLMGITLGILSLYKTWNMDILKEFKKAITSTYAIIIYIFIATMVLYFPISNYYFTGDDFTWFRWISDKNLSLSAFVNNFTQSDGFFYRPGTKTYFSMMYSIFWFNQTMYHLVSIFLHFAITAFLFLILKKIFRNNILPILSIISFIVLSGHHEAIFWIASTGFLFNAFFVLLGILSFILFREKKKKIYFIISLIAIILSLMFHELGVVAPLLIILYDKIFREKPVLKESKKIYISLILPLLPYLILRFVANSHWFNGDYSYNLFKLPYNAVGNIIGYVALDILGTASLPLYEALREFGRNNILIAVFVSILIIPSSILAYRFIFKKISIEEKRIVVFAILFFTISLLPFLGLGNITSRYSYLSSIGFVIIFALVLKKIYFYLVSISDKYIGIASIAIVMTVYCMIQLFGLQKIHTDWQVAGEMSKRFLISIEEYSKDFWIRDRLQFYFVDLQIKRGEAWIWPVGLKDALWFVFKNPRIAVYTMLDINSAFDQAEESAGSHVFRFDSDGNTEEVIREKNGRIRLLNPPR